METFVGWGRGLLLLLLLQNEPMEVRFCRQVRWFSRLMETFVGWGRLAFCACPESNTQNARVFSRFLLPSVSPMRKMHEFFRVSLLLCEWCVVGLGWGLPEAVVRSTFLEDRRVAFFGKYSF